MQTDGRAVGGCALRSAVALSARSRGLAVTTEQSSILLDAVVALGDDALVLGQRLGEWCGKAPMLEEDLAMANTALDFLGRARLYYGYAEALGGCDEDTYAFQRDAREFRNLLLYELPCADFAAACVRQFLIDVFDDLHSAQLAASADPVLAGIGAKANKEASYHRRHSSAWLVRLGDGTQESNGRMQKAMDDLWGFHQELFANAAAEEDLVATDLLPDRSRLLPAWTEAVSAALAEATLETPAGDWSIAGGRQGVHTEHLGFMLAEMQHLPRIHPGARW